MNLAIFFATESLIDDTEGLVLFNKVCVCVGGGKGLLIGFKVAYRSAWRICMNDPFILEGSRKWREGKRI